MNSPCHSCFVCHPVSQELADLQFGPRLADLSQLRKQRGISATQVFLCRGDARSPLRRGVRPSVIKLN